MAINKAAALMGVDPGTLAASSGRAPEIPSEPPGTPGSGLTAAGNRPSLLGRFKNWLRRNAWLGTPTPAMPRGAVSTVITEPQRNSGSQRAKNCLGLGVIVVSGAMALACGAGGAGVAGPRRERGQDRNDSNS